MSNDVRAQIAAAEREVEALALAGREARKRLQELKRKGHTPEGFSEPEIGSVMKFSLLMEMAHGGRQRYDYAALRAGNGRWYITGAGCPVKGFDWEGLWAWISQHKLVGHEVGLVAAWSLVGADAVPF